MRLTRTLVPVREGSGGTSLRVLVQAGPGEAKTIAARLIAAIDRAFDFLDGDFATLGNDRSADPGVP